jgi:hypothetical protein
MKNRRLAPRYFRVDGACCQLAAKKTFFSAPAPE